MDNQIIASVGRQIGDSDIILCQTLVGNIQRVCRRSSDEENWKTPDGSIVYGGVLHEELSIDEQFLRNLRFHSRIFTGWNPSNMMSDAPEWSWTDMIAPHFSGQGETWTLDAFSKLTRDLPPEYICDAPLVCGEVGYSVGGRCVNRDVIGYQERMRALFLSGVLERLKKRHDPVIVEIGGGYGALAYFIKHVVPQARYYIIDLPRSLIFSGCYLTIAQKLHPVVAMGHDRASHHSIVLVPAGNFRTLKLRRIDLAINTLSFAEMPASTVSGYAQWIARRLARNGVLFEQNFDGSYYQQETFCDPAREIEKHFYDRMPIEGEFHWGKPAVWRRRPALLWRRRLLAGARTFKAGLRRYLDTSARALKARVKRFLGMPRYERVSRLVHRVGLTRKLVAYFRGGGTLRGLLKIATRKLRGKMLSGARRVQGFAAHGRASRRNGKPSAADGQNDEPKMGDAPTLRAIGDSRRWVTLSQVRRVGSEYKGHAIYRFEYKYFGIPAALGSFSYDRYRRGDYGRCPIGHSISEITAIIDRCNGTKTDRPIGKRLLLGCLPREDMSSFILAESSPNLALLVGAEDSSKETGEIEVIRLPRGDISQWIRNVASGRNTDPSKDIGGSPIATVLLPWKFPETWHDDSLERAAAALANHVEVIHSSGTKRTYFGENLHRLVYNKAYLASMFEVVPSPVGQTVLEVGCSDGMVSDMLASLGAEKVVGIDVMTTVGCAFPGDRIEYRVMDAAALSFPDRSFEMVCSIATLEHVPDPLAAIREMIRVVRIGGYGYIQAAPLYYSPFGHHMFAYFGDVPWVHLRKSKGEIVEYFKATGKDADLRRDLDLSPEQYIEEMLNPDHLNGAVLADFRLDELRQRTDIEILKLNISHEGRDLLTPAIFREIRTRYPRLREEQLVEHGFEIAFRRVR
jgi:SAM-dependent methyltransferase